MRTIRFRAKRSDDPRRPWFIGFYYNHGKEHMMFGADDESAMIDPRTLGQFCELTDARGQDIYEGDVLHIDNADGNDFIGYVRWSHGGYWLQVIERGARGRQIPLTYPGLLGRATVVNNIYDEPDILAAQ